MDGYRQNSKPTKPTFRKSLFTLASCTTILLTRSTFFPASASLLAKMRYSFLSSFKFLNISIDEDELRKHRCSISATDAAVRLVKQESKEGLEREFHIELGQVALKIGVLNPRFGKKMHQNTLTGTPKRTSKIPDFNEPSTVSLSGMDHSDSEDESMASLGSEAGNEYNAAKDEDEADVAGEAGANSTTAVQELPEVEKK